MGKPDPPKPPDPYRVAAAQTEQNVGTALAEAKLNRVNEVTPYGSVTYSTEGGGAPGGSANQPGGFGGGLGGILDGLQGRFAGGGGGYGTIDDLTGAIPQYTRTVTESPNQEALREGQEGLGISLNELATEQTGRVGELLSEPYDPRRVNIRGDLGGQLDLSETLGDYGSDLEKKTYDLATSNLGREFDRAEEDLRSTLANQGITPGSDAFAAEMESFRRGEGQAYTDATLRAREVAEASRMARMSELMQERGTNLSELLRQYGIDASADLSGRQVPLQEISSIMHGTPLSPINPGAIATSGIDSTNVAGIIQNDFANKQANYQQKMAGRNAIIGGLFGLGGAAVGGL